MEIIKRLLKLPSLIFVINIGTGKRRTKFGEVLSNGTKVNLKNIIIKFCQRKNFWF